MLRTFSIIAATTVLGFAMIQPAAAYDRLPQALAQLSPADFASQVRVIDDPREAAIVLSTEEAYTRARAIKGAHADDVHLRALVDRRTGKVSWQVWHDLIHVGGERSLHAVSYQAGGMLQQAQPTIVERWLDRCPPTDAPGACNQAVRVAFDVPEQTVREIAQAYRPGERMPWQLSFKDSHGRDVTGGLAPAEAAGLIAALEAWRAR